MTDVNETLLSRSASPEEVAERLMLRDAFTSGDFTHGLGLRSVYTGLGGVVSSPCYMNTHHAVVEQTVYHK